MDVTAAASNGYEPVFEMSMPIRWGDMDAFGHVNNTVYFRYMEQVRISWFEAVGIIGGAEHGPRSAERRVGTACSSRWSPYH